MNTTPMTAPSIREALEGLVEAVRRDADEGGKGISGYTSARLSDARAALAAPPQDVVGGIARVIVEFARKGFQSIRLTRDVGPYEITEPTPVALEFATAILASGLVTAPDEAAIRADERERCAQEAFTAVTHVVIPDDGNTTLADHVAAAIRAGGAKKC